MEYAGLFGAASLGYMAYQQLQQVGNFANYDTANVRGDDKPSAKDRRNIGAAPPRSSGQLIVGIDHGHKLIREKVNIKSASFRV